VGRSAARHIERLVRDQGITHPCGKIEVMVTNARRVLAVQEELGSFAAYVWCSALDPRRARPLTGGRAQPRTPAVPELTEQHARFGYFQR